MLSSLAARSLVISRRFNSTYYKAINAIETPEPGNIHNKRPFKYNCKAGRAYMWCSCGWSRTQPFCDGTHKNSKLKIENRPIRFECTETKDYWFCQCKQTKNRPFCDGSHNLENVKATNKVTINYKY